MFLSAESTNEKKTNSKSGWILSFDQVQSHIVIRLIPVCNTDKQIEVCFFPTSFLGALMKEKKGFARTWNE